MAQSTAGTEAFRTEISDESRNWTVDGCRFTIEGVGSDNEYCDGSREMSSDGKEGSFDRTWDRRSKNDNIDASRDILPPENFPDVSGLDSDS